MSYFESILYLIKCALISWAKKRRNYSTCLCKKSYRYHNLSYSPAVKRSTERFSSQIYAVIKMFRKRPSLWSPFQGESEHDSSLILIKYMINCTQDVPPLYLESICAGTLLPVRSIEQISCSYVSYLPHLHMFLFTYLQRVIK